MNQRTISRRDLLGGAALSGAGLPRWMPRMAFRDQAAGPARDTLVCLFQRGGMDGLSAVVPYEEQRYYDLRTQIAFRPPKPGDAAAVLPITDQFGLAPALSGLKSIWDDGHLAVVHATGSPHGSRSHFEAMGYMERGSPGDKGLTTGWLGRHLKSTARAEDTPFRALGFGAAIPMSLRGPIPAASLRSIAEFHMKGREDELARFKRDLEALWCADDWLAEDTRATFEALAALERANPLQYQPENGATYPQTELGQGLKQIAQLIKADLGLEIACIDIGGWDTHVNQVWTNNDPSRGMMYNLLQQLDQAVTAFYRDLGQRFVEPGVTLLTMSEFGRRVAQNAGNGTDHGEGGCMFVVSGAANRGVHTQWPGLEPENLALGEDLAITIDYRDVLSEILIGRMGSAAMAEVFPGYAPHLRGVVRHRFDAPSVPPPPSGGGGALQVFLPYAGR